MKELVLLGRGRALLWKNTSGGGGDERGGVEGEMVVALCNFSSFGLVSVELSLLFVRNCFEQFDRLIFMEHFFFAVVV